jgi:hypothetical protein
MAVFVLASLRSAFRARNGELGDEARAVFAALVGYLVCQQFSGYALSWFLYAMCAFAACCEHWAPLRRPKEVAPSTTALGPMEVASIPAPASV